MADPHLRKNLQNAVAAKLASPTPGTNAGSVDDMALSLTEALLSNAAGIAPPIRGANKYRGAGVRARRRQRNCTHDGRIGKTRGNGFVLLETIVVYGKP